MRSSLFVAATLLSTIFFTGSAKAQVRTGIDHPTYGSMHGYTVHEHASDHARLLYHYARTRPRVPRQVVLGHARAIGGNLRSAKNVNDGLTKAKADDQTAQRLLASISGHDSEVTKHLKAIETAAQDGNVDSEVVARHAKQLYTAIQAALKDHQELHKHLGGEKLTEIED